MEGMADKLIREAVNEAKKEQGTLGDGGFDVKSTAEEARDCSRSKGVEDKGVGGSLVPGK